MALSAFVGQITQPTSTGNQATTGVGFQPKIVLFWGNDETASASAANAPYSFGAGVSSSDRRSVSSVAADASSTTGSGHDNTKCYYRINNAATILNAADLVSLDSDGFTLNWTTVDATARKVNYLALGGADLTNVKTFQFTENTTTGNQAITGIGFQPDAVMLFEARSTGAAPPTNGASASRPTLGFGKSSTIRGVTTAFAANGNTTAKAYQRTASLYAILNDTGSAMLDECDLVSLDSDGLTVNWTTVSGAARYVFGVALKGGQFNVGSFNQATSTGNQAVTGNGFQPVVTVFTSFDQAAASTIQANGRFTLGAASSSSARASAWSGNTDGGANRIASQNLDSAKVIKMMTEAGASPTVDAAADFVSMDSDGFTVNWSSADATARQILYFAVGSAPAGGGGGLPFFMQEDLMVGQFAAKSGGFQ